MPRPTLFTLLWMGYLFLEFSVISVSGIQVAHKSVGAHVSFPIAVVSLCWESWVISFNDYLLEMFVNAHPMCLWLPFTSVTDILSYFYYKPVMSPIKGKPSLSVIILTFKSFSKLSFADTLNIKGFYD